MKVLMLTTNSSLMDGINRHILTVAPALNAMGGCEVAVCTVMPRAELAEALEKKGVKTFSLQATSGHDFRVFGGFCRVMRSFSPDIVHCHVMALYERLAAAVFFRRVKYVETIHGIADKVERVTPRMRVENGLNAVFRIPYSCTCYISRGVRDRLAPMLGRHRSAVCYNPLPFEGVQREGGKLRALLNLPPSAPIVGTCCRLSAVKNPRVFTEVMCRVLKATPEAHAAVAGDGAEELKRELKALVEQYGVGARFHWLGYRQDAPELARDFSCFVMTSLSEGLPTSVLEAMVAKIPFAMMEGEGGLKDLAELNRTEGPIGLVSPKGDAEGMSREICRLLQDPTRARALADKAFEVGRRHFDIKAAAQQLNNVYQTVCDPSSNM